jgi:hypothetical protein
LSSLQADINELKVKEETDRKATEKISNEKQKYFFMGVAAAVVCWFVLKNTPDTTQASR